MSNTNKILLSVLAFCAAFAIGFFGTDLTQSLISKQAAKPEKPAKVAVKASGSSSGKSSKGGGSAPSQTPQTPQTPSEAPSDPSVPVEGSSKLSTELRIIEVTKPEYDESSESYGFDVTASGMGIVYVLSDEKGNVVSSQESSHFTVKGTSSGNYILTIQDVNGNKSEPYTVSGCFYKVRKVTAAEFERVLNSKETSNAYNADFKNRISPNCRYDFRDRHVDEGDAPASYGDIIMRLKYNTWSSVSVQSVSYDSMNRLSSAIIKVNY